MEPAAARPLDTFRPGVLAADSPLAIASLATGILCWFVLPFVGAVVAVVTGIKARREIRASGGAIGGWTMATVGLWSGAIHLMLFAVVALFFCALAVAGVGFLWFNR
jgi:hypothetical protein